MMREEQDYEEEPKEIPVKNVKSEPQHTKKEGLSRREIELYVVILFIGIAFFWLSRKGGSHMPAWYSYPRIDNYGAPDPFGGFPKPDSNILCPENTPITSPLAGIVSGINAPDGSLPAWGAVVTIKLLVPYNPIADHIAFLHLSSITPGLKIGSSVSVGQVIGVGGSGPHAAGTQKAALGFAFYHGDFYGYGPTWAQYDGKPELNPVPFLVALAVIGLPPPLPLTQTITVHSGQTLIIEGKP